MTELGEPMPEEQLAGGATGGAVRVGETVRKASGPWTPAVLALLEHLAGTGLKGVPVPLGEDHLGRTVVSYLPGTSLTAGELPTDELLSQAATWLRCFHDAVADYRPSPRVRWRNDASDLKPDEIICHHDVGTYNWIVSEGCFVGMIDWDQAGPGVPLDDLAFMAWTAVPLEHQAPLDTIARRLDIMASGYGRFAPTDILDHVIVRMSTAAARIAAGQRRGDPGMIALGATGQPDRLLAALDDLRARTPALRAALTRRHG